ncbi:unnamed protein product [Cyclocybe aegerita]|uniref:Uncharacterized protein n=1 Tax=Cyclocybe aegerita TaxID=1973307 RepID=A0A8S0XTM5_CYCAE|nr:unnamed protein product [Cyclocybe aegerita]
MSRLWDTITVDFSQPRSTLRVSLKYLQIMLGRSSDQLLRISLISGPTSSSAVFEALADVIPACERWEEFSISAPYDVIVALDRPPLKLPSLRRLDVKLWSGFGQHPPHEVLLRSFNDCPVLHTASITGNGATVLLISRWHQLHSFGGRTSDLTTIQKFLASYPQITCLSITIVPVPLASNQQTLNMPAVRCIKLFFDPSPNDSLLEVGRTLLRLLILPSVEEITTNNLPGTLIQDLKLLLKRSTSTRVKKLYLLGMPSGIVPAGSITELLELCPDIVDLELPLPPPRDLSNLVLGQNSTHLVPGLKSLTFHNDRFDWNPGAMQTLTAITSSRCEPRPPSASPFCSTIHLRFPTEDACLDAFAMLHDVRVGYGRIYLEDVNETFCKVLDTLEAPCEENWVLKGLQSVKAVATKSTTTCIQRLSYVIEFSEDSEAESVKALYRSKVHHAMLRFIQLNDSAIPGNQKHNFKERGLQTLRQWCKILLEDAPNCKWGFEPPGSLVYIPTGDSIRQSKLHALKMFFGLDMSSGSLQCLISKED